MVIFTQLYQVMNGQFVCPSLIARVHRLGCSKHICDILLGLVGIFAQIAHDLDVIDATPSQQRNIKSATLLYMGWRFLP